MLSIVGSRDFKHPIYLGMAMELLIKQGKLEGITGFVSGGAKGADTIGQEWATQHGLTVHPPFLPEWHKDGKYMRGAALARNSDIVKMADVVVAFPRLDPARSKGTYDTIRKTTKAGKPLYISNNWDR